MQLSECNRRQHITAVCGIIFYFLVEKKPPLVVSNGGKGKTHAKRATGGGIIPARCVASSTGGKFGACSRWGVIGVHFGVIGAIFV